jgi:hypothetical protein
LQTLSYLNWCEALCTLEVTPAAHVQEQVQHPKLVVLGSQVQGDAAVRRERMNAGPPVQQQAAGSYMAITGSSVQGSPPLAVGGINVSATV